MHLLVPRREVCIVLGSCTLNLQLTAPVATQQHLWSGDSQRQCCAICWLVEPRSSLLALALVLVAKALTTLLFRNLGCVSWCRQQWCTHAAAATPSASSALDASSSDASEPSATANESDAYGTPVTDEEGIDDFEDYDFSLSARCIAWCCLLLYCTVYQNLPVAAPFCGLRFGNFCGYLTTVPAAPQKRTPGSPCLCLLL